MTAGLSELPALQGLHAGAGLTPLPGAAASPKLLGIRLHAFCPPRAQHVLLLNSGSVMKVIEIE